MSALHRFLPSFSLSGTLNLITSFWMNTDCGGNAHLTDFNIAAHFGERKLTGVAGSMAYMAPEYVGYNSVFSFKESFHAGFY
jgi:serine/threonine protein kinase